jgi:hypothetical protein
VKEPRQPAPAPVIATKENENVIPLDERQPRRRRFHRPVGAAAAILVVLAAGGVLWARRYQAGRRVEVADRPAAGPAAPAMLTATYDITGGAARSYRLTVAADGSYRWTSRDGNTDLAYDAATGRAVEVVQGPDASGPPYAFVYTGVPTGGPGRAIVVPEPIGSLADFVTALGRSGDRRVEETSTFGRPAWRYDGPIVVDQLGGRGTPDHAVADVDQATGVLLSLRETSAGRPVRSVTASSVEVSDRLDRSRFQLQAPPGVKTTTESRGFRIVTLDEGRRLAGYDPLVPGDVPEGFRLQAVAVDPDVRSVTGAEGMNPPAVRIVTLRYANGFHAFTVTQRPKGTGQWDDPFGAEGMSFRAEAVKSALPGRPPLEGSLILDPPSPPHVWGITGDLVVTVDGDLGASELRRVAGSFRAR